MINLFEKQFDDLAKKIKSRWENLISGLKAYFKKLLFPLYLFPIKLLTYSAYYLVKFLVKLIVALIGLIIECLVFPFKSLKNFLKSIFIVAVGLYLIASLFVIGDYLKRQYGWWGKFLCLTNFHVIADEPSPKVILADGSFLTPNKIIGNKDADLALLFTEKHFPELVLKLPNEVAFYEEEPLVAVGYPLGTSLSGKATVLRGNFVEFRKPKISPVGFIQTNISLVEGMSGGPLTDQCGQVVGVNTLGLAGMSFFITAADAKALISSFTDQGIKKIQVDPSLSPEEAVRAFYTYLKARRMEDGFNLLSKEYLKKTNFEEWTSRFKDILDVSVVKAERFENTDDTAFVKFWTKNWVDGEAEIHYYEGTWETVKEDGVYKMLKSKILEVENPGWLWFYE